MTQTEGAFADRAARERAAYDAKDGFRFRNHGLHGRFAHVRHSPSMTAAHRLVMSLVVERAMHGSALELGCGIGAECERLVKLGARRVHGIDISSRMLEKAHRRTGFGDRLAFFEHDAGIGYLVRDA